MSYVKGSSKATSIDASSCYPRSFSTGTVFPAVIIVLNKRKLPERKGKVLLIHASRHYQSGNPQNLLRRADCFESLMVCAAFGDLEQCRSLVSQHGDKLVRGLSESGALCFDRINDAYGPLLEQLGHFRSELVDRGAFAEKEPSEDKNEKKLFRDRKKANAERVKELRRQLKVMERMEAEAEEKRTSVRLQADREIALAHETAADLLRICSNPDEAEHFFMSPSDLRSKKTSSISTSRGMLDTF